MTCSDLLKELPGWHLLGISWHEPPGVPTGIWGSKELLTRPGVGGGQQTDPCVLMGQIPELPAQEEGLSGLEPPQNSGVLEDMLLPHAMLGN